MKQWISIALGILFLSGWPSYNIWAAPASPAYQACLVKHVRSAKSPIAAHHLQQVCARRAMQEKAATTNTIPSNTTQTIDIQSEGEDHYARYDACLLQHLPPVHNDESAQWMIQFCQDQFAPSQTQPDAKPNSSGNLLQFLQRIDSNQPSQPPPTSAPLLDGDTFVPLAPVKTGR